VVEGAVVAALLTKVRVVVFFVQGVAVWVMRVVAVEVAVAAVAAAVAVQAATGEEAPSDFSLSTMERVASL